MTQTVYFRHAQYSVIPDICISSKGYLLEHLTAFLELHRTVIDDQLSHYLDQYPESVTQLVEAMRYALFAGGKRIRPILMLAVADMFNYSHEKIIPVACAVELIHTSSLIIDDLPSMDNADVRRGKPSIHKTFGEATAVLTGFAMLNLAFAELSRYACQQPDEERSFMGIVHNLARAIGLRGMIGGQMMELEHRHQKIPIEMVEEIHRQKTGAIFVAGLTSAALLAGATNGQQKALQDYAANIGLMFQIIDDLLDVTGSEKSLGKPPCADLDKTTYVSHYSKKEIETIINNLRQQALHSLSIFGEKALLLEEFAYYSTERKN